ncbi:hypothetical protein [Mycobacterium sp.]|uniref:hypothetical protein n=1 Tax=Mycobacterium sp. TaxID=1785 RepID=UPI0025E03CCA|nr:hypothetical protein [Mycobacterium sp.]
MTTPGGVPNLPQGALTIDTLQSKTQDMSPTAMKGRAANRIAGIFGGSTGSDPMSPLTPFGFLTTLFAGFQSIVANADPNDINGPEDLPGLLTDFIESLPVVGEFVRLFDAIKGTYEGDDDTLLAVQSFFVSLRAEIDQAEAKADAAADKWAQSIDQLLGMGHGVEDFINMLQGLRDGNLSVLAPANTNRLDNPNFNGALSISDPSGDFVWDSTVSRSPGALAGSARATADGSEKELRSNKVSVAPGQVWTFVANLAAVGLAGAGSLAQLTAQPYDAAGNELPPVVLASSGALTGSGVWTAPPAGAMKTGQLTADWTVPAGVTRVSLRMILTENATAGSLWLDDMSLSAKSLIPQDWVKNLTDDLTKTFTWFTQVGQIVAGQAVTDPVNSSVQQFRDWWASNLGPAAIKARADQDAAWAARKQRNDQILNDWSFYYPFGSPTDTAATLVGGKRTKWGAWNDNFLILGEQLGVAPPPVPLVDLGSAVSGNSSKIGQVGKIFAGEPVVANDADMQKVKDYNAAMTGGGAPGTVAGSQVRSVGFRKACSSPTARNISVATNLSPPASALAWGYFPNGFFGFTDNMTPEFVESTWNGRDAMTVVDENWYMFQLRCQQNAISGSGVVSIYTGFLQNGHLVLANGPSVAVNVFGTQWAPTAMGGNTPVFCEAGDQIVPVVYVDATQSTSYLSGLQVFGEPSNFQTYWSMNKV